MPNTGGEHLPPSVLRFLRPLRKGVNSVFTQFFQKYCMYNGKEAMCCRKPSRSYFYFVPHKTCFYIANFFHIIKS